MPNRNNIKFIPILIDKDENSSKDNRNKIYDYENSQRIKTNIWATEKGKLEKNKNKKIGR